MSTSGDGIKHNKAGNWIFDREVTLAFDQHVRKSIPIYDEAHEIVCLYSDYFCGDYSKIVDIGSSTGTLLSLLAKRHTNQTMNFIGIDTEVSMIDHAKQQINDERIKLLCGNAVDEDLSATMITSLFTIQFVPPSMRQKLITKIYNELEWGGAFFYFEKMRAYDARFQDYNTAAYWEWKSKNGYSDEEILNKHRSLKGVMEPFSLNGNMGLLTRAGFQDIEVIWAWGPFKGLLAIK